MGPSKSYLSKVAANGQVVIPKQLRDSLGLKGGDTILFSAEEKPPGILRVVLRKTSLSFRSMVGGFKALKGRPTHEILKDLDDEEMR